MPVDPKYIEQLVLEEIAGVISPEDHIVLKKLIDKEPDALKIWKDLHAQLPESYMEEIKIRLIDELPSSDDIISLVNKRKIVNFFTYGGLSIVAVTVFVWIGIMQFYHPIKVLPAFVTKDPENYKNLTLEIVQASHTTYNLDSTKDSLVTSHLTLYKQVDTLAWISKGPSIEGILHVPYGREQYVRLPDGTLIWMSPGSAIRLAMPLSGREREIYVDGEVFLNVAEKANRPFQVHIPDGTINVLGTGFNVNTLCNDSVAIALTEGKIRLLTSGDALTIHPGEAIHYKQDQVLSSRHFNPATLLNRQKGLYYFNNETIETIAGEIDRVRNINLVLDPSAHALRFTGEINMKAPISHLLRAMKIENKELDYIVLPQGKDSVLHIFRNIRTAHVKH